MISSTAAEKAYFIQDYEPFFHPVGEKYLAAERTYALGLRGIVLGRWLAQFLLSKHGMQSKHYDFCSDLNAYQPADQYKRESAVCFIYQPNKPRRCADLGLQALKILKERRPASTIYLYGSHSPTRSLSFQHTNLGLISIQGCNDLYQKCRVGLCISSSNPSRIPFEMMATGLPVVEIHRENNLQDFPTDGMFLSKTDPESLADAMINLLEDDHLHKKMSNAGIEFMKKRPLETGFQQVKMIIEEMLPAETRPQHP